MPSQTMLMPSRASFEVVRDIRHRYVPFVADLAEIDFGSGAAQQEQHLTDYFYRSGSFNLAASDKTFLVLGAKGAGKSAIFRMLQELSGDIPIFQHPNRWFADEPQLRDHWDILQANGIKSQETLWRFYAASLIAKVCLEAKTLPEELRNQYERFLARWGLVREVPTAWQTLKKIKLTVGFSSFVKAEFPPTIPPTVAEIDYVIFSADAWLNENRAFLWLLLDSLDEVSTNGRSHDDAENLLSNLMRAVAVLIRLKAIRFKLFFRTDIYQALTYVNKDHFSAAKLELRWSKEDLAILLAHRLQPLHPEHQGAVTFDVSIQWIDEVFDWPPDGMLTSFENLYTALQDGNKDVLPRDLIQFCVTAQTTQANYNIQATNRPRDEKLISSSAIREAFKHTSQSKLNDFLQVFRNFSDTYDQLKGSPSQRFTRQDLSNALGKADPLDANFVIADLVRVGALEIKDKRGVNQADDFEIPFLYALALQINELTKRV